ncbi:MAG: hypothetical protein WCK33_11410 [Phycisphaerae bacterium]
MRHVNLINSATAWVGIAAATVMHARAWAGPLDRSIVDPGAIWLVHLDMDAARNTPAGEPMLSLVASERRGPLARMEAEMGISPTRDLKSVTLFGLPGPDRESVLILTTSDAADHLGERLSKADPQGYRSEISPEGVPIHVWRTRRGDKRAAVYPGRREGERFLAVARSKEGLASGIHALTARAGGPDPGVMPPLEPQIGSMVFFSCGDLNAQPGRPAPSAAILQAARSLVIDIGHAPVAPGAAQMRVYGRAVIDTADAATAVKVQHMAQGILALNASPREGEQPGEDASLMAELAKGVSIAARDHRCDVVSDHDPDRFAAAMTLMLRRGMEAARSRRDMAKTEPSTTPNIDGEGVKR